MSRCRRTSRLQVFCHVFTGAWREPLDDLIAAFNAAALAPASPTVRLGIIGPQVGREAVVDHLRAHCDLEPVLEVFTDMGYESITINAVRRWAQAHPGDSTLYCHTKGASRPIELNAPWRRAMIESAILPWRKNLGRLLLGGYDAAGPFWLDPATAPEPGPWCNGFFAGNFWLARNEHLARLPECQDEPRGMAEEWVGMYEPRVLDLLPGFPNRAFFGLS